MTLIGLLHGASNYTFLADLNPHPPAGLKVVYKPARGESPLWDFTAGTLYQREVAAYQLSRSSVGLESRPRWFGLKGRMAWVRYSCSWRPTGATS